MGGPRHARWAAGALLALTVLLLLPAGRAAAAPPPAEQVRSDHVVLTVRRDGLLHVHEAITYDFGSARDRHGLVRRIPFRTGRREYDVEHLVAGSPDAPAGTRIARDGGSWTVRVGDTGSTVTGVHTYLLDYDVRSALTPGRGHDDLDWDAIGTGWSVPTADAAVTVTAPAALASAACTTGGAACRRTAGTATSVTFAAALGAHQGMTVHIALPHGAVTVPAPTYAPAPGWWRVDRLGYVLLAAGALVLAAGLGRRALLRLDRARDPFREPPDLVAYAVLTGRAARLPAALLVELAERGHVRITSGARRFTLTRTDRPDDDLDELRRAFLAAVFPDGRRGATTDPQGLVRAWRDTADAEVRDTLERKPRGLRALLGLCAELLEDAAEFGGGVLAVWALFMVVAVVRAGAVTDLAAGGAAFLLLAAGVVLALAGGFATTPQARRVRRFTPPPVERTRHGDAVPREGADVVPYLPFVVLQVQPGALERAATGRTDALDWYEHRGDPGAAAARFALLPWLFTPAQQRPRRSEDGRWTFPGRARRFFQRPAGSRDGSTYAYDAPRDTYPDTGSSASPDTSSGGLGGGGGDSW